ncbi:MacB family efflux pump subunit [Ponticaulis sp.]|uniref:MacB family efflux pump subunit n=1 Tax=Ponticaulis sp. TaxID=2020902 RepID=UPI000B6711D5|nr:MacB family efflux pump subunit [Ponticaulis sp.]MAI89948.1 macrolide ABC transporter permease/ATP-binding protein MacB [Ponticaulis sp.]OUX99616.1 MAG: macrolide ABC transporter permease/ATP-binding protein MacB [Hyphomonadaceae bacterium TMED5]|tara:strand:+ start:70024 stop:71976 length:1953 start_codon:yes stop_codon:yes gene_type:complete
MDTTTTTLDPVISLEDVRRIYGSGEAEVRALDGVSLKVYPGEFIAIVGQSGSGKSTLMNILGCLDRPTSGSYEVNGRDVADLDNDELATLRRESFGFIFQRYNLLTNISASENVEIPAIYAGLSLDERRDRAEELLETLGLGGRGGHKPGQLSGGQQQRVAVARALINDAEIILADEPTGALDSGSSAELLNLLVEMHLKGRTIILITHDPKVAERAERVIEISDGKIIHDDGANPLAGEKVTYKRSGKSPSVFVQIAESVKMAFRSLQANLFRTALTLLGVVIGVSAVVAMLAIGEGSQREVMARFESMGSNLLFVNPGAPGTRMRGDAIATLTIEDAEALAELDNIVASVPSRSGNQTLRVGSNDYRTSIQGVNEDWPLAQTRGLQSGAFFTEQDVTNRVGVVVLGTTTAGNLFDQPNDAVGEYVFIGGAPFEVAGILEEKGANSFGRDEDDIALIPITTGMMRIFGQEYLSNITMAVEDTDRVDQTEEEARQLLLARHGTEDFQLRNTASLLESVESSQESFSILLGSVAAISLLVGGIGVMNIMLVSVSERTREIGVRMATGARRSDIMIQFVVEALVVGGLGGLVGVSFGLGACFIMEQLGMTVYVTSMPATLAFSSALATGLIFGYLPARKAARLDPVAALSSE